MLFIYDCGKRAKEPERFLVSKGVNLSFSETGSIGFDFHQNFLIQFSQMEFISQKVSSISYS